jgi:hypothetical protein
MKLLIRFLLFLLINFSILYAGNLLMGDGASTEWYKSNKSTLDSRRMGIWICLDFLMTCFAAYLAKLST